MIRDLVRSQDRDRYLAALLAPAGVRDALLAVYAFNIELSRVAEVVREPHLGEIRLQWWRDAVAAGKPVGQAVADGVTEVQTKYALPEDLIQGMIDARGFDLDSEPMPTMAALRQYLGATAGAVFEAGARICGAPVEAAAAMARHAGVAYGLTGMMRTLPFYASHGKIPIPADVLSQHGVDPDTLFRGEDSAALRAALAKLRVVATAELDAARTAFTAIPAAARAVFLPLALVEPYLAKLAAPRHRPLHDIAELSPLTHVWRIWRAHRRRRI